jgi:HK97 family phage major capsid protein
MTKEQYLQMRNDLMKQAEAFIAEGKFDESEAKMQEVKDLDNKWEGIKLANANLNALKENSTVTNFENKSSNLSGGKVVENIQETKKVEDQELYKNAWAKSMMGINLDETEQSVFTSVNKQFNNAYTHDTGNTTVLIPESVAAGIWSRAEEMYPLYADARKFAVTGKLTIKKHVSIDAGDAAWYTEAQITADEQNTFGELNLDGHELAKAITVSWKLKSMAIADFIPYITNELGERIGVALGVAAYKGTGTNQPRGVETALLAEAGTPQVTGYDPDGGTPVPLTYDMVVGAIAKLHSSYLAGANIYASNATIWTQLATLKDDQGRPLFIPDVTQGGVGRMFGMVVKPDAAISKNNILIGNPAQGLVFNVNEPLSIATEDHVKARTTDYAAYTIVDGDVMDEKAFALIRDTTPTV